MANWVWGPLLRIDDARWNDTKRHVTVHLELIASNAIALHVETFPCQAGEIGALENKNKLVRVMRSAMMGFSFPGYVHQKELKGWGMDDCTAIGKVKIDPSDIRHSANILIELYRAIEPRINAGFARYF